MLCPKNSALLNIKVKQKQTNRKTIVNTIIIYHRLIKLNELLMWLTVDLKMLKGSGYIFSSVLSKKSNKSKIEFVFFEIF